MSILAFITSPLAIKIIQKIPTVALTVWELIGEAEKRFKNGEDRKEFVMNTLELLLKAGDFITKEALGIDLPDEQIMQGLDNLVEGIVKMWNLLNKVDGNVEVDWQNQEVKEL